MQEKGREGGKFRARDSHPRPLSLSAREGSAEARGEGAEADLAFFRSVVGRDLADVPDEVLDRLQPVFFASPLNAAIRAMGLE